MIYDYDKTIENITYFLNTAAEWINHGPFHVDRYLSIQRDGYVGKYSNSIIRPPSGNSSSGNKLLSQILKFDEREIIIKELLQLACINFDDKQKDVFFFHWIRGHSLLSIKKGFTYPDDNLCIIIKHHDAYQINRQLLHILIRYYPDYWEPYKITYGQKYQYAEIGSRWTFVKQVRR